MIHRGNHKLAEAYLEYRLEVDGLVKGSYQVELTYVHYLLEWLSGTPFEKAETKRPTLPDFLLETRLDGKRGKLSSSHIRKVLATARRLFRWLRSTQKGFRGIRSEWIATLKPRRQPQTPSTRKAVSLDDIMRIASAPVEDLIEKRVRAAAVFWFLSGIRISAFVSLPLRAVDLEKRLVYQFPELGVKTKNGKRAVTYLLPIPELLPVVESWDAAARAALPESSYWFAPLSYGTGDFYPGDFEPGEHRDRIARRNLRAWLERVGLSYHSPHEFRHGHIHFGVKHAKDMADLKAVSLNAMHSSITITDRVYSRLEGSDVKKRIQTLGEDGDSEDEIIQEFREFLKQRKQRR